MGKRIAYKGFQPGLVCRGYQFQMGLNVTDRANCGENGFHCAEDPMDCLTYYSCMERSEYYVVQPGGDVDEDQRDSKISCTELTILKKLEPMDFFLHALAYMVDHPLRTWGVHVTKDRGTACNGFTVVRGVDPVASGKKGDILALAKESADHTRVIQVAVARVDGKKVRASVWYDIDLKEKKVV